MQIRNGKKMVPERLSTNIAFNIKIARFGTLGAELKLPLYGRFWASSALQCEPSANNWFRLATGNPRYSLLKTITLTCVRGRWVGGCLVTQHLTGLTIRGPCKFFDLTTF